MVLEKENAIADLRKLMGATNPANAEEGTIRKKFAGSMTGERHPRLRRRRHGRLRDRLLVRGVRADLADESKGKDLRQGGFVHHGN